MWKLLVALFSDIVLIFLILLCSVGLYLAFVFYEKGNGSSQCAHLRGRGEGPGACRAGTGGTETAMLPNLCSLPPCSALLSPRLRNRDVTCLKEYLYEEKSVIKPEGFFQNSLLLNVGISR